MPYCNCGTKMAPKSNRRMLGNTLIPFVCPECSKERSICKDSLKPYEKSCALRISQVRK